VSDQPAPSSGSRWSDRREVVRLVAGVVVIVAFLVLAALAIAASRSDLSITAPTAPSPAAARRAGEVAPPVRRMMPGPVAALPGPALPADVEAAPATGPTTAPALPPAPPAPPVPVGVPCPQLGLPAPEEVGGIQSLVRLIPLFGPFSPEAFAFLPAVQPGIDALGPLFPTFQRWLDAAAPVLDVVVPTAQQLGEAGFGALAPLYGPVREDVLAGERALAAYLAPIVESLAEAPGSECLVALEGLLASLQPETP
jgi:hypothetical protein